MYSMVLMAALATGTGAPDQTYGFGGYGWNGWGGYGLGWGGWGGNGLGWGGWGGNGLGWGGYSLGGMPAFGGYAYSPMMSGWGWGAPYGYAGGFPYPGMMQSFYYNPAAAKPAIEARIIVHMPPQAALLIDDQPTMQRSSTRIFSTPPLEPGKTYTYTLRAELNRDGRFVSQTKKVEVRAGQPSEVTLRFGDVSREELGPPTPSKRRESENR